MEIIKKLLGFDSPYSWTKWIRIAFAIVAFIVAGSFWSTFGSLFTSGDLFGFVLGLILFVLLFTPTFLTMMGIAALIGLVIGGDNKRYKTTQKL